MAEPRRTVVLEVWGKRYRVSTTASEEELGSLAGDVVAKTKAVAGGQPVGMQAVLMAAMALAHDARVERARAEAIERKAKEVIGGALARIDAVLGDEEDSGK